MASALLDPSKTERIVLLIDLYPLIHSQNSKDYVSAVLSSAKAILTLPSLSASLFTFKFFFSSLSPSNSSPKIPTLLSVSSTLYFDLPSTTFNSLSEKLPLVASLGSSFDMDQVAAPRASLIAESLRWILHQYPWETALPNVTTPQILTVRSNLFILFCPFPRFLEELFRFVDLELGNKMVLSDKFSQVFNGLSEAFIDRDIYLCWVDVNFEEDLLIGEGDRNEPTVGIIRESIITMGWGFCSTDVINLGSAVVPFDLIFPRIACSFACNVTPHQVDLSLEILDVNSKPLNCSYDVELLMNLQTKRKFFLANAPLKICIKRLFGSKDKMKINEDYTVDFALVRTLSCAYEKNVKDDEQGNFMDRVLEMLTVEKGEFVAGKPAWQLLLNFLQKECLSALISVVDTLGNVVIGILRPFTVHSAIVGLIDRRVTCKEAYTTLLQSNWLDISGFATSSHSNHMELADEGKRRSKMNLSLHLELSWHSFRKEVLGLSSKSMINSVVFDMEKFYLSKEYCNSKKLKFLKCWMKQMKKFEGACQSRQDKGKDQMDVGEDCDERNKFLYQAKQSQESCSFSLTVGDNWLDETKNDESPESGNEMEESDRNLCATGSGEPSPPSLTVVNNWVNNSKSDGVPELSCLGTEDLFQSVSRKIQEGLNSEEVNLGFFAEQIVASSVHWLHLKHKGDMLGTLVPQGLGDVDHATVFDELTKLLLRKPRDLAIQYKGCSTSEKKVREHELQILFRMEILQLEAGITEEAASKRFVKDICLLLENIIFNLQGGIFGGESLAEFAERVLKNRYSHSLEQIIYTIYTRMEFYSSGKGDQEISTSLNDIKDETNGQMQPENKIGVQTWVERKRSSSNRRKIVNDEHELSLMIAEERREKPRRFSSFTSWVPDLQRVWAPKCQKRKYASGKVEPLLKLSKNRWRRRGARKGDDVVCETPMLGTKRTMQAGGVPETDAKRPSFEISSTEPTKSKKALFQRTASQS